VIGFELVAAFHVQCGPAKVKRPPAPSWWPFFVGGRPKQVWPPEAVIALRLVLQLEPVQCHHSEV
jgi:hypothetical protein